MGEGLRQRLHKSPWTRDEDDDELFDSDAFPSDSDDDDTAQDHAASSSSPSNPSASSGGPLYELSSLMEHLPIKRGLSQHYQGKSQSFSSLAEVSCLEDLPKKEAPYKRKMKPCKSYAAGLDAGLKSRSTSSSISSSQIPGPCSKTIGKKTPRVSSCASLISSSSNILHCNSKPPPAFPVQKNFFLH